MRSGRDKVYQIKMTLQCLPCFSWGTTQKHRPKIRLWVAVGEWPCTSPPLRSRVSVPAVAAVSAVKESCAWAALPEQNGARGGGRDQRGTWLLSSFPLLSLALFVNAFGSAPSPNAAVITPTNPSILSIWFNRIINIFTGPDPNGPNQEELASWQTPCRFLSGMK